MAQTDVPSVSKAKQGDGPDAALQRAVLQLRSDYEHLVDDSQDVVVEAAKALARAAMELAKAVAADARKRGRRAAGAAVAEARKRPVTTAAIAIATASTALAAALSCREAARSRGSSAQVR